MVLLTHCSLSEQMPTGPFSMVPPLGTPRKEGLCGAGDAIVGPQARLELVWKVVGISPSRVGVTCLICASQPQEGVGIGYVAKRTRPPFLIQRERDGTTCPPKDRNSHVMKDEVLGQDGRYS